MATNLPVSTRIWNFLADVCNFFVFIVFGNPLTMVVFNFFSPRRTKQFVGNKTYFGKGIYGFYNWLFLLFPFRWAKWWIDANDATCLQALSIRRQVIYFNKVSLFAKTFNSLSAKAKIEILEHISKSALFKLLPDIRFSDKELEYLRDSERYDVLEEYIRYGALSATNIRTLIETSGDSACDFKRTEFLEKYAIRYKLSDDVMDYIFHNYTSEHYKRLERANLCYEQIRKVHYFVGLMNKQEEKEWAKFCAENMLEPEAQAEMTLAQYRIFAQAGCHLAPKAILALLHKPNEKYWGEIFNHEPDNGLLSGEIKDYVIYTPQVWKIYFKQRSLNPL